MTSEPPSRPRAAGAGSRTASSVTLDAAVRNSGGRPGSSASERRPRRETPARLIFHPDELMRIAMGAVYDVDFLRFPRKAVGRIRRRFVTRRFGAARRFADTRFSVSVGAM